MKIRNLCRILVFTGIVLCSSVSALSFPLRVNGLDSLNTAILIRDLRFGLDIVSANIDRSLIPASVMKSVTVASMLNLADTSECFVTPVMAEGIIRDSVLAGNLVVRVCGDPTIESRFLPASQGFADSIAANETEPFVPDLKFSYVSPKRRGLKIDRKDGSETFVVTGSPRRALNDVFSTPYPSKVMRHEIVSVLRDCGITVEGRKVTPEMRSATVYEHRSPNFGEIMRSLMHRSDNLMAEGMLRAITPGGTRADAIREEMSVWAQAGVSAHGVVIKDGSGLSRDNRLTARFLAGVFQYMLTDPFGGDYMSLFPRAGYDGTMRNFLAGTSLEGRVAMKTGSMKGVQSYAGYLFGEDGHPTHLIIFMVNNFRCSRAALKSDIERLLLEKFDVSLQSENISDEETITEYPDNEEQ